MATSLMDDHDSELNRLRIVIDNYASDGATVIRVENLRGRLGDFVRTISDLGLVIHDCRFRYHSSRLWHSVWVFNVTDDNGNKIAYERAISDIQTAIEEMERRHLTRMNAPPLELDESYLYMLDPWSFGHAAPIMRQCDLPSIIASLRDVFKKTGLNIFDAQSHDPAEPIMERRENPLVLPDSKWSAVAMVMRSWFRLSDSNFTIDNEASDDATVVRIFGSDTPFCAAVQANIANGLGLTICSASTHEETVFGVTDREGNKVTDEATISDIRAVINRTEHRPQITRVSVLNDGSDYAAFLRATRNCLDMWDNPLGDSEYLAALPRSNRVDKRTLLNPSHYCEERCGSKMYALVTTRSSMSRDLGTLVPCLWLDSGASHHMVGDITILINLRDLPIRRVITTADGSRLAVAKVGDIQMPDIKIRDVFFVPGLQMSLVSVRQLGKNKVVTTFYENHAELWSEGEQIGGAVVDDTVTLYKLRYLH